MEWHPQTSRNWPTTATQPTDWTAKRMAAYRCQIVTASKTAPRQHLLGQERLHGEIRWPIWLVAMAVRRVLGVDRRARDQTCWAPTAEYPNPAPGPFSPIQV